MKHQERLEMLRKIEESIPIEMKEVEDKLKEVLEIEQADELQLVKIKLHFYLIFLAI
jgi:hypothetical protein